MKPKIKRTKQPDILRYEWEDMSIENNGGILIKLVINTIVSYLTLPQAKELAEVLPKFLEEMERTK